MAEFYKDVESLTGLEDQGDEAFLDISAIKAQLERERNEIRERRNSNSLVASLREAAEEMRVESSSRSIGDR